MCVDDEISIILKSKASLASLQLVWFNVQGVAVGHYIGRNM
jgi:hypothetical protein